MNLVPGAPKGYFGPVFFSCHICFHILHQPATLYNCLDVKELLPRNRRDMWKLSDCNEIRNHNHLVRKHLAKLAKRLSCVMSIYLHSEFECVLIMSHTRVIANLHSVVAWMSRNSCSKQAQYLKFKSFQSFTN